jgi:hypothetical protein
LHLLARKVKTAAKGGVDKHQRLQYCGPFSTSAFPERPGLANTIEGSWFRTVISDVRASEMLKTLAVKYKTVFRAISAIEKQFASKRWHDHHVIKWVHMRNKLMSDWVRISCICFFLFFWVEILHVFFVKFFACV